jgi:hypothetical protein
MNIKPSELIKVLQEVIDAGNDDNCDIYFDTEGRSFDYHMAEVHDATYEDRKEVTETPFISLTTEYH